MLFLHSHFFYVFFQVTYVNSEKELFNRFAQLVKELDPDILVGYEVQLASWGFLRDRAEHLGLHLLGEISRVPCECVVSVATSMPVSMETKHPLWLTAMFLYV